LKFLVDKNAVRKSVAGATAPRIKNSKHEIRNKSKMMKNQNSKLTQFGFDVLDFPSLRFIWPPFVSDFVLRISDFVRQVRSEITLFVTSVGAENVRDEFSDFGG
jgi:hypothetical protein